jgi:adenosylcobinamide-phosphate synthase
MAGALGVRLGGPRAYAETMLNEPWTGDGRTQAGPSDIRVALRQYRAACILQFACVAAIVAATAFW